MQNTLWVFDSHIVLTVLPKIERKDGSLVTCPGITAAEELRFDPDLWFHDPLLPHSNEKV